MGHTVAVGLSVLLCDAVEQTVPLTLAVGERLIDVLVVKVVETVGLRDWEGDVVKEEETVGHTVAVGLSVLLCDAVEQTVPLTLAVGERLIDVLVVKVAETVGLRDCELDVV